MGPGHAPPPPPQHYQHPVSYRNPYSAGPWSYQAAGHLVPQSGPPPVASYSGYYYPPQAAMPTLPARPSGPGIPPSPRNAGPAQNLPLPPPPPPTYRGRSHANLQWQPSYTGPRELVSPVQIHYYQIPPHPSHIPRLAQMSLPSGEFPSSQSQSTRSLPPIANSAGAS